MRRGVHSKVVGNPKPLPASPCQGRSMALPLARGSWRGFVLGVTTTFECTLWRAMRTVFERVSPIKNPVDDNTTRYRLKIYLIS